MGHTVALYLLLLSVIGPNVASGVRAEHLILGALFAYVLLTEAVTPTLVRSRVLWLPLGLFAGSVICVLGDLYVAPASRMASYVGSLGRMVEPSILFTVFYVLLRDDASGKLFRKGCCLVLAIAGAATALSLLSWVQPENPVLSMYQLGEGSVGSMAMDVGRYVGAFNQPMEAGIFFSVALFCLYRVSLTAQLHLAVEMALFVIVSVGGFLSISKNFYIIGYGSVFVYLLISDRRGLSRFLAIGFVMLCGAAGIMNFVNPTFFELGADMYDRLGAVGLLSAGRFGVEGTVSPLFDDVLKNGVLTGMGLGTFMPLDSGYLEYLYQGGILALSCYLIFIGALLFGWFAREVPLSLRRLQVALGVFIASASLGGPVITSNRACVVLFFLVAGTYAGHGHDRESTGSSHDEKLVSVR